jgi:nickel-dependent lactate racemase
VTSLNDEMVKKLFAVKVHSVEEAIRRIEEEKGNNLKYIVMPQGSLTVPVLNPDSP